MTETEPTMQADIETVEVYLPNGATLTFERKQILAVAPGVLATRDAEGNQVNYFGVAFRAVIKASAILRPSATRLL